MPRMLCRPRWLSASLVASLFFTLLMPISTVLASADLVSGDSAVIADANGDSVRLRTKPGSSSPVVAEFPEGTSVSIIDGPTKSSDGTFWYRAAVDGQVGYIAADFLALAGSDSETPEPEEPAVEPTPAPTSENPESGSETAVVTGTATIGNTNGDPIRCRSSANTDGAIIGLLYEGMPVDLTGEAQDGWQPVRCEDGYGWIAVEFLVGISDSTATPTLDEVTESELNLFSTSSGTGVISGTNGDGVRCRSNASTSAGIITTLAEGVSVELRGSRSGDWQPVKCSGKNGYVWAAFVSASSSGSSSGGSSATTGDGVVYNTNGQGVRCRQSATFDGRIIGVMVEGDAVQFRAAQRGVWQPVVCGGKNGYIHADYVKEASGDESTGGNTGGNNSGGLTNGDSAKVSGTGGTGVRLRSKASSSASVLTVVSEGAVVTVRSGSTGDWIAVKSQSLSGFIHKDYLVATDEEEDEEGDPAPSGALSSGDHAKVTSTLNFRSEASYTSSVIGVAVDGIVVLVTGNISNGFYPVEWGGLPGFMHGDYLAKTDAELTGSSGGAGGAAGDGTPSSVGRAMVDYADNYLGYPYIWATAGPNSFDCSGFTYWVTKHVLGQDIGRGLWTQIVVGSPVSYGSLKPGDLVFFQNTYTWGLSHVGIYIGNNQFIHAENEDTGVRISSLTSTYYSTRYYGAVRLG